MIHTGDCVEVMAAMDAESVDAIVTDPPYGLEFMGKEWDRLEHDGRDRRKAIEASSWEPYGGDGAPMPRVVRSQRKRCRVCGLWSGGTDNMLCKCDVPDWIVSTYGPTMQTWHQRWATEAYRVAKPGAHLLAFGGPRTYHRLASAIEDAGFEIRDCLVWAYASGFPKSLDVSKAMDKAAGAEREVVGIRPDKSRAATFAGGESRTTLDSLPATDAAKRWQGWGTALKPAWEPIVMARKPLRGTVAANVEQYGVGALNIDGTRIGVGGPTYIQPRPTSDGDGSSWRKGDHVPFHYGENGGRWPPNLLLTDPLFDGGVDGVVGGGTVAGAVSNGRRQNGALFDVGDQAQVATYGDTGTYSRFFLIAKSSRSDREPLLPDYALALHRESGQCDKLNRWASSTSPERVTSEESSTDGSSSVTSPPGKPPTDPSPTAIRSTTSTATSRTTDSTTSSSSTLSPTSVSTPAASFTEDGGTSPATSAETSIWSTSSSGIYPEKDGRSTDGAAPATFGSLSKRSRCAACGKPLPRFSTHPTQKPTELMRHLVRLVTPPGGTVLDCFLGSGTTAIAAEMEGFAWIGIEREAEYVRIAEARLVHVQKGLGL